MKGTVTETWTYDANSNRLTDTETGASTVHYAYNAADQLCWHATTTGTCTAPPSGAVKYGYDANGNTTLAGSAGTTQAYNVFDQFTTNTNGSTVTNYTYAGTRNDERITAGSTSFLNGSLGLTQQTKSGAATSFIRDPDGTLISMRTSTGASYYYTTDAIGSTIVLTDSAQAKAVEYKYDSWGVHTSSSGTHAATNPWTYAGGYNDTTSNRIKFGARYYNPSRGRFTQPDPSNQEQNRYLYAAANPVNNTDPTGYFYIQAGWTLCFFGCAGGSFGWDAANGFYIGETRGVGFRAEAAFGVDVSPFGEAGGADSIAAECSSIPFVGKTIGVSLPNPIGSYVGGAVGLGGGCSLMFTSY